jgi:hypothetical protein
LGPTSGPPVPASTLPRWSPKETKTARSPNLHEPLSPLPFLSSPYHASSSTVGGSAFGSTSFAIHVFLRSAGRCSLVEFVSILRRYSLALDLPFDTVLYLNTVSHALSSRWSKFAGTGSSPTQNTIPLFLSTYHHSTPHVVRHHESRWVRIFPQRRSLPTPPRQPSPPSTGSRICSLPSSGACPSTASA